MRRLCGPILILGCALGAAPAPAVARTHKARVHPHAFASCARLVSYEQAHFANTHGLPENSPRAFSEAPTVAPLAQGKAVAPAPAASERGSSTGGTGSYSTTNNQEPGVEEPDSVKTDGATIFAIEGATLFAVAAGPTPHLEGSLALGNSGYGAQLLIRGSRLLVISGSATPPVPLRGPAAALPLRSPYFYPATTTVSEVDAHDPAAMSVARTFAVEGTFVDARQNGGTARLVISSAPRAVAAPALRARASGWVPTRRFHSFITGHERTRPVVACGAVQRPAQFSGLGMLTILTIDLDRGLYTTESSALLADAQLVYGSEHNLYVATQRWISPALPLADVPSEPETVIDQFDATKPDRTPLVASGTIRGYLLNQFSLSEQGGYLRAASTSRPIWWAGVQPPAGTESRVTVLADRAGALTPVGQVSGLGAGQQIYSVRFIASTGYVVTFRHVDPLYTIDLSSPTSPRVVGQLELEGYSAYLHPVGAGLLLGVGREVGSANQPSGAQLELFDVSDPSAPRLLAHASLGGGSSTQVQFDHHAFLFWPPTSLAVLPVSVYPTTGVSFHPVASVQRLAAGARAAAVTPESASPFVGAVGFRVDRGGLAEVGRIAHDPVDGTAPAIDRSLVIGARLFTLSSGGVMASSLTTLERQAFVPFPQPAPGPLG